MSRESERVRKRKRPAYKMNLLIISDTHGKYGKISDVIELQRVLPRKDRPTYLLHLGDGANDVERAEIPKDMNVISVKGNCDRFYDDTPSIRIFTLFGKKIVAFHGHEFSVKHSDVKAEEYAIMNDADILLYGHTHRRTEYIVKSGEAVGNTVANKDLYVFNPGSLGYDNSFGVITVTDSGVLFSFGHIK